MAYSIVGPRGLMFSPECCSRVIGTAAAGVIATVNSTCTLSEADVLCASGMLIRWGRRADSGASTVGWPDRPNTRDVTLVGQIYCLLMQSGQKGAGRYRWISRGASRPAALGLPWHRGWVRRHGEGHHTPYQMDRAH